jgi:hypothetical protein
VRLYSKNKGKSSSGAVKEVTLYDTMGYESIARLQDESKEYPHLRKVYLRLTRVNIQ